MLRFVVSALPGALVVRAADDASATPLPVGLDGFIGTDALQDGAVNLQKLADLPGKVLLGRSGAGDGRPEALSPANTRALLETDLGEIAVCDFPSAQELSPAPSVNSIRTIGRSAAGDRGGARYRRVASEPKHPGKLQTADNSWWTLSEPWPTPEMFGAKGNGVADDIEALEGCFAYLAANGGGVLKGGSRAVYGISRPLANLSSPNIVLDGGGLRSGAFTPTVIRKLPGFKGEAAIVWGRNAGTGQAASLSGGGIRGIRIDGNGQEGDGLVMRKCGNLSIEDVTAEGNQGWGFVIDGVWLAGLDHCAARKNGGGIVFDGVERKCSDIDVFSCHFSNNDKQQLLVRSHPADRLLMAAHLNFFGGICELPAVTGSLAAQPHPVAEIEACVEINFFGMNLMQRGVGGGNGVEAPALVLGKPGHTLICEHVGFHSGRIQHDWSSAASAIFLASDVGTVSINHPALTLGVNSKLVNATNVTTGILAINAPITRELAIDPKGRVAIVDARLEAAVQTASGGAARLAVREASRLSVGLYDSAGIWSQGFEVGGGARGNLVRLTDMCIQHSARATPDAPGVGTLFYWNGEGVAPDGGANGPGLYLRKASAWVFVA